METDGDVSPGKPRSRQRTLPLVRSATGLTLRQDERCRGCVGGKQRRRRWGEPAGRGAALAPGKTEKEGRRGE